MSVESVTQSVSNLALAFGDDDAEGGVMVSEHQLQYYGFLLFASVLLHKYVSVRENESHEI